MDPHYWTNGLQINASAAARPSSGLPVSGVADSGQSVNLAYSTVDMNSAASLEFLLGQHQQRFASGLSFLPYSASGTSYSAHVLDGSQNAAASNVLTYNAAPKQSFLPGVFYEVPTSVAIQAMPSSVSGSAGTLQYKSSTIAVPAIIDGSSASAYRSASQMFTSMAGSVTASSSMPAAPSVSTSFPSSNAVHPCKSANASIGKPTAQQLSLADLFDFGSTAISNQVVTALQGQATLRHSQLPSQTLSRDTRQEQQQLVQSISVNGQQSVANQGLNRAALNATQISAANTINQGVMPAVSGIRSQGSLMQNFVGLPVGNQQRNNNNHSSGSVQQSFELRNQLADKNVTYWPYDGISLMLGDDQRLVLENAAPSSVACGALLEAHDPTVEQVVYEAVSPAGAVGSSDHMGFNFLDSLQLSSLFGSTVDASALYSPQTTRQSFVEGSKSGLPDHGRQAFRTNTTKSAPVRDVLAEAFTQAFNMDESDRSIKPKPNLGIVLPFSHGKEVSRSASVAPTNVRTSNSSSAVHPAISSYDCNSSMYTSYEQPSFEKPTSSAGDTRSSAGGGIVLTNITGNVYVNQYTMLPGGTQTGVDNALLHTDADLTLFPTADDLVTCRESFMQEEECYGATKQGPPISVVLQTNETDDELGHLAVDPMTGARNTPVSSKAKNNASVSRKSVDSNSYSVNSAAVLKAKPSNQFESCFLKFLCGHKSETLSSVLNSPIRARPELPKYIPEVKRPRSSVNSETSATTSDVEIIEPSNVEVVDCVKSAAAAGKGDEERTTSQKNVTKDTIPIASEPVPVIGERPDGPKLPAKFSHKWKNRTTLPANPPAIPVVLLTQPSAKEIVKDTSDVRKSSHESSAKSSTAKKSKSQANQQWTVAKKPRLSSEGSIGLKLVLKAVTSSNSRSTTSASKPFNTYQPIGNHQNKHGDTMMLTSNW